ncbi:MAG: alpha/beta hydrolase [Chloroflexi bacterium]|nr:alpha/beta hydrolase [Chloroflexota bacterium]
MIEAEFRSRGGTRRAFGTSMFFAPFPLLFTFLVGLLSLAVLGGGLYLLWAWYVGVVVGTVYLVLGLAMMLWTFLGRLIVLLFHPGGPDEPHTLEPESEVRLLRPDGTSLYLERYGPQDAPTIIFTHGAGANRTSWYYAIRALSQRFQVIVWDMPGLGHSHKPRGGDYSLERHAQDLSAVVEMAAGQPTVLVGHSMGGMVVLTFCRLFPELLGPTVKALALVDTSHTNPARTTTAHRFVSAIQKPVLEPLLHLMAWFAPVVWVMSWLAYLNGSSHVMGMIFGFAGSQTRGQLDLATRYNPLAWPGVQARETLAMFRYDAAPVLGAIPIPTLVFTGDLDRLIVPETAQWISQQVPHAQLTRLAPAGHMALFERHDLLVAELTALADKVLLDGVPSLNDRMASGRQN